MQKISTNYLNKKMPPIHELTNEEINQQWYLSHSHTCLESDFLLKLSSSSWSTVISRTVWSIWRSLLEETDKLAKAKLAAVEIFQTQIADDVKTVRQNKLLLAKKVRLQITSTTST